MDRRSKRRAALVGGALVAALGTGCSSAEPSAPVATGTTDPPVVVTEPVATLPVPALAEGACPPSSEITVYPRADAEGLGEGTAMAVAVTTAQLDPAGLVIGAASYAVAPEAVVDADQTQPVLTGDQVLATFRLSAAPGVALGPSTYDDPGESIDATLTDPARAFLSHGLFIAAGRVIAGFPDLPASTATITKVDDTVVCGTVVTAEFRGTFRADRLPSAAPGPAPTGPEPVPVPVP